MNTISAPLVSFVIGIHNLSPRWKKALESIKGQTYGNWECIICDDCSTDNSYETLKKIEKRDSRFKIIRNKRNLGLAAALNKCIKYANGTYIARMDDDDVSLPTRLESEINFLENNKKYSFVSSSYYIDNGKALIQKKSIEKPSKNDFLWTSPYLHPSSLFKKSILMKVNGYTEGKITFRAEDYDLYMKLYSKGYIGYNIQKPLYIYYVGENEVNKKSKYKYRIYEAIVRLKGFRNLNIPSYKYFPFVLKPLFVGLLPKTVVYRYRTKHNEKNKEKR